MGNYIRIIIDQSDISDYQDWQMQCGTAKPFTYTAVKTNGQSRDISVSSFTNTITITLEAQSNFLPPYPTLSNGTAFSKSFTMGGSAMDLEISLTPSDFSKIPTTSIVGNSVKTLYLSGVKYYKKPEITLTLDYNLTNCSVSPNIDTYTYGDTQILTITPNDGYKIETPPTITDDENFLHNFVQGDNNVWTFNLSEIYLTEDTTAHITAVASQLPVITLTYNTPNCNVSPNDTTVIMDGSSKVITITPQADFTIDNPPRISNGSVSFEFTQNGNYWTFDLATLGVTSSGVWTVTAIAVNEKFATIEYNLTNAEKSEDSPDTWENGTYDPPDILVKPNDGYIFNTIPTVTIIKKDGSQQTFDFAYNQALDYWVSQLTVIPATPIVTSMVVNANAVAKTNPQEQYSFLKLYNMNDDKLTQLSTKRFIKTTGNDEYIDIGQYILNIFRYPFKLSIGDDTKIVLGAYSTDIDTSLINETLYKFISNPILVSGLYNNASDILHCTIEVFLPYHGIETIDSRYINTEISIEITVEIITNTCNYVIKSNDQIIATFTDSIADVLPYILKGDNMIVNDKTSINITPNVMYIRVEQRPSVEGFLLQTKKHLNSLVGIQGYIQTQNYAIETNQFNNVFARTLPEELLIIEAMNNGVYI